MAPYQLPSRSQKAASAHWVCSACGYWHKAGHVRCSWCDGKAPSKTPKEKKAATTPKRQQGTWTQWPTQWPALPSLPHGHSASSEFQPVAKWAPRLPTATAAGVIGAAVQAHGRWAGLVDSAAEAEDASALDAAACAAHETEQVRADDQKRLKELLVVHKFLLTLAAGHAGTEALASTEQQISALKDKLFAAKPLHQQRQSLTSKRDKLAGQAVHLAVVVEAAFEANKQVVEWLNSQMFLQEQCSDELRKLEDSLRIIDDQMAADTSNGWTSSMEVEPFMVNTGSPLTAEETRLVNALVASLRSGGEAVVSEIPATLPVAPSTPVRAQQVDNSDDELLPASPLPGGLAAFGKGHGRGGSTARRMAAPYSCSTISLSPDAVEQDDYPPPATDGEPPVFHQGAVSPAAGR